jgi:hypothetical protein
MGGSLKLSSAPFSMSRQAARTRIGSDSVQRFTVPQVQVTAARCVRVEMIFTLGRDGNGINRFHSALTKGAAVDFRA